MFVKNIGGVLEDQYFGNRTDGMKGLLAEIANKLTNSRPTSQLERPR